MTLFLRVCFSSFSGVLLAFGFAPFNGYYLAWVALVYPLYLIFQGASFKQVFLWGFVFGFSFYSVHMFWIFALSLWSILLMVVVSFFYAILFVGCRAWCVFFSKTPWTWMLGVPTLWCVVEMLRTVLLTGMPWGTLGYSQHSFLSLVQWGSVAGVYGISFMIMLVNTSAAIMCLSLWTHRALRRFACYGVVLSLFCLSLIVLWGFVRHRSLGMAAQDDRETLRAALVQGDISPYRDSNQKHKEEDLDVLLRLSQDAAMFEPDLMIWPETAMRAYYTMEKDLRAKITTFVQSHDLELVLGAFHQEEGDRSYNATFLLSPVSSHLQRYDKTHLVPFGEYMPHWIRSLFPQMAHKTFTAKDTSAGEDLTIFHLDDGKRFASLICYEVCFPTISRRMVRNGAQFLVNISNDAYIPHRGASEQQMAMAVFRAVENGVDLVRVSNGGVSRIVTRTGQVRSHALTQDASKKRGEVSVGTICLYVQNAENAERTVYSLYGDIFLWTMSFFTVITGYYYSVEP